MKRAVLHLIAVLVLMILIIPMVIAAEDSSASSEPAPFAGTVTVSGTNSPQEPEETPDSDIALDTTPDTTGVPDTPEEQNIPDWFAIVCAAAGVLTSFIIPVLKQYAIQVKKILKNTEDSVDHWKELVKAASPYIATTLLSCLMAVVVVAVLLSEDTPMPHWYVPFLAGYLFDATVQKIKPTKDDAR